ncbi:MAG: c-type cytochrome [Chthoniobacter sp.]|nr:c-type cytochrome [Chthoniobacter sp.]
MKIRILIYLTLTASGAVHAANVFDEMVRSTPWLSPADELKSFVVPEGFAVQLVSAEPEIGKPISMSFDAAGRLWVAETNAYPIETAPDKTPRDSIRILSDFAADGRVGKNVVFADGLSMPDAVAPYRNGAIVFSIPNIVRLQDTDGDGKADQRDVVLGPFTARDTHNLANNFRRGFDGWMYGGAGVGNDSRLKGRDGAEFHMSGGTFRFSPDGSRIMKFGDGQANVFGLCFDPLGNLFTSDCHSMPIYQNIYGGFYPVFGKPHDGLGYAPQMLTHNHGSTAISGLIACEEPLWPAEFQGNFFLGNVVTSRVNRDRIEEHGSTKLAREMPDLVVSRDPWFRPVDVQFGPDGALYIADFYNRIIAHVEVPLNHQGRDRKSGRIWRVVRVGADGQPILRARPDFTKLALPEKIARLADPSLAHRLAVLNFLADQGGDPVIAGVRAAAKEGRADLHLQAAALWLLERLGGLTDAELASAARHTDRLVRAHAMRILVERANWKPTELELVLGGLKDADGFVARAAADALARHPAPEHILPLLALRQRAPDDDTHLVYQARKALRDQLLSPEGFAFVKTRKLTDADARAIADVALALPSAGAADFLVRCFAEFPTGGKPREDWVRHIARFGDAQGMDALAGALTGNASWDLDTQTGLLRAMRQGMEQRGMKMSAAMNAWAARLAAQLLAPASPPNAAWQKAGAELAGKFQLAALERPLGVIADAPSADPEARVACLRALLALNATAHLREAESFLKDAKLPPERHAEIVQAVAQVNSPEGRGLLVDVLRLSPERFATIIATALGGSAEGADALVHSIEQGQAPPALLAQRAVKDKLLAAQPKLAAQISSLTANISPTSERLQKVTRERANAFPKTGANAGEGAKVFQANCTACHSLAGQGGSVGPQLDGIGHRGVERLCEDILDPNRNVDRVFRYSIVTLTNGTVISGLFRREEGAVIVFVDATGKEIALARSDIASRAESATSLMPEAFAETIPPASFNDLLTFLLSQSAAGK